MIWASSSQGLITYAGPEWAVFTGQPIDAALGDGWLKMLHVEDRQKTHEFFKAACASKSPFTVGYRLHHISAAYIKVIAGAVPSISPVDKRFIGFLGTVNEIEGEKAGPNIFGKAIITAASSSTKPLTAVDIIADYLLLARTTAYNSGEDRLLASIDFAVSEVMRRLGYTADIMAH